MAAPAATRSIAHWYILVACTAVLCLALAAGSAPAAEPIPPPRMVLNPKLVKRIKDAALTNRDTAVRVLELKRQADAILRQPLLSVKFEKTYHGKPTSMLKSAREAAKRLTVLPLTWRLTGSPRYAERAVTEMLAIAKLPNWNPDHFLDTAEMATAMALGYDWLGDSLSAAERATVRRALVTHAIEPGLKFYRDATRAEGRYAWVRPRRRGFSTYCPPGVALETCKADQYWPIETYNWNLVCNTGLTLAALAVRDDHREIAETLLDHSLKSVRLAFGAYAPDGGWPEGPEYWSLATRYAAILIESLEGVLGTDFGLSASPGFERTGDFILHLTGPTGLVFNYGDSVTHPNRVPTAWTAKRFHRPQDAWFDRRMSPGSRLALDLVWRISNLGADPITEHVPTTRWFAGVNVVTLRSEWNNEGAVYVGFKAGDNHGHHTHLDLGSFVLDGEGVRWAIDVGPDRYVLPGYFGKDRFRYYRTATIGQNTLMLDGKNQSVDASAEITAFGRGPAFSFAISDLSAAYGLAPGTVRRGVALFGERTVVVRDEIGTAATSDVEWSMHTRARVSVDGATATLGQEGQTFVARIVEPDGAMFLPLPADPCSMPAAFHCTDQNANKGITRLTVTLGFGKAEPRVILVQLEPGADTPSDPVLTLPLRDWLAASVFRAIP